MSIDSFMEDRLEDGLIRLKTRWPQAHMVRDDFGRRLVFVPSVLLPKGYMQTICTVFFVTPPGFPGAHPRDFFTDIDVRLNTGAIPERTSFCGPGHYQAELHREWPQWAECKRWFWKLQDWDPNRDGLYTYMKVIQQRLNRVGRP